LRSFKRIVSVSRPAVDAPPAKEFKTCSLLPPFRGVAEMASRAKGKHLLLTYPFLYSVSQAGILHLLFIQNQIPAGTSFEDLPDDRNRSFEKA
jgi:hypothetical protein